MKKQVIILFGPPGAGKGTQAELLSEKLSLYYFETSKILEKEFNNPSQEAVEIDNEKFEASNEKQLWLEGKLCSPPFVSYLVKENIKKLASEGENLILAGSPRTVYEGEKVIPLLKELYGKENIRVVLIEISPEETIFRNSHRRICELMRHPILYSEETKNLSICPLDGSKLVRREGLDDPETIKTRLKEYADRTYPVIEIFKEQGIKVKKVNGEQPVADVFKEILSAME
ncbi:MAG: nucleoside monophosphate kinase [bacterium]|nr:nucleoside monophosphate kinase [bacterium]